ncbi:MAG: sulfurtransferase [Desulfatiglans sp.]|jgi:thiosulfate/3-mercaptopyruvate sulfurtransferase|nr:sulfurtransferase [Desulfatiglans sp.]
MKYKIVNRLPVMLLLMILVMLPSACKAREIPPFVSTDWLEQNINIPGITILDIREDEEYQKGHIPGAINVSVNSWAVEKSGLVRELPDEKELLELLGSIGVKVDSKIVVVGRGISDFDRADAIRVAWTILIAGVKNVSVTDGGFSKWVNEKRVVTLDSPVVKSLKYDGKIDTSSVVSKAYVLNKIGKTVIVDNRTPDVYSGAKTEPWAPKPGHIKGAVNLPTPFIFDENGMLKGLSELEAMAQDVIGKERSQELIFYCGAGPFSSVWSYLLTEMLGYTNVKVYDGSMQEWIMEPSGPVETVR